MEKFQPPRGTRDFFPSDMAWRNRLLDAWRRVSIRHGFEHVDGPIYESLELYKVKSGEGIVSELFHFADRGGRELAIRPEFTPTLARMVADRAPSLPRPIKWFCIPNLCRAERPQRGRVREHWQWNVDLLGLEARSRPVADAEVLSTAVDFFQEMGLGPQHVRVRISHREVVRTILNRLGVADEKMLEAFNLVDRRDKILAEEFMEGALKLGLDGPKVERLEQMCRRRYAVGDLDHLCRSIGLDNPLVDLEVLAEHLEAFGIAEWCEYDLGIVRGLAYYTGTVFEMHEATGVERAIAGGGRYDQLIELFGGPSMPAVGFGMGDVVITNVLADKGLIPQDVSPQPDVFVMAVTEQAAASVSSVAFSLRRQGVHARFSYKSTRHLGKLLKEANGARARYALILDDQVEGGSAMLKDLKSGAQEQINLEDVPKHLPAGSTMIAP